MNSSLANETSSLLQDETSPSTLYDAARITDWNSVLQLSQNSPHLASFRCSDNITPLHHVCTRRCPQPHVVQGLIKAHPPALIVCDEHGWTPLHHASRFKAPKEAIRLLLNLYPEYGQWSARRRDNKGRTPLYYALRYDAPSGVVELLLEYMRREDVLEGDAGNSIMELVWDSWATTLDGKKILGSIGKKLEDFDSLIDTDSKGSWEKRVQYAKALRKGMKGKLKDKWKTANLLLRGAFRFPLENEYEEAEENENDSWLNSYCRKQESSEASTSTRKWRVLHATTAVRCHPTLFKIACAIHPEQAREIDTNDLFSRPNGGSDRRTALHFAAENSSNRDSRESRRILLLILAIYPEAASLANPADGRLPLHYLCKNNSKVQWHNDGLREVHDAYPRAALVEDKMGRTPLHHAASIIASRQNPPSPPPGGNGEAQPVQHDASGSIMYELVRIHPNTATIVDNDGKLPLHVVAMAAETWDSSIQALYEMFPVALRRRTSRKAKAQCPIHLVSSNPIARSSLVNAIVKRDPMGATLVDGEGKLPLHIMCEAGKTLNGGLECVYDAYKKAISTEDTNRGWLPLHFTVTLSGVSVELIRNVLNLYPLAAREVDGNGRTALHLIVETSNDWECIEAVFSAYPAAINVEDSRGKVPLIAAALFICDGGSNTRGDNGSEREGDALLIESLSLQPTTSWDGSSTLQYIQGSSSMMSNTAEEMSQPSRSRARRNNRTLRDTSLSELNVIYNLLRAAPHVLN